MKVSRDHTLYYHPHNHLSPQKMVAFSIHLCYSCMRCGVWRSLVARTAGGREVAGSNPVAPIEHYRYYSSQGFRGLMTSEFFITFITLLFFERKVLHAG